MWSSSTPPPPEGEAPLGGVPLPSHAALEALLDRYAPLGPAPLSPEVRVFRGRGLIEVWEAAEALAGRAVPPPFWAYPWPGGAALARVVLDRPAWVAGRRVLDLGAGGGVASLAAARAGAREVVANDQDAWALSTVQIAAERQGLRVTPLLADLTEEGAAEEDCDVILCADMAYERRVAPRIRALLERAAAAGARVLVADAGRAYFDDAGLDPLARFTLPVPRDLEGVEERTAAVYRLRAPGSGG